VTRLLAASLAFTVCFATSSVIAADLSLPPGGAPPVAVAAFPNWTGFYVGAHVGGAFDQTGGYSINPCPCTSANGTITGALGGLQAGYNYQVGSIVAGVEADVTRLGLHGSYPALSGVDLVSSSVNYDGTVTARLGAVMDQALIYLKGGAAATHSTNSDYDSIEAETFRTSYWKWGGVLGGGLEYSLTTHWSAKLEYDFIDTGTKSTTFTARSGDAFAADMHQRINLITLGLNYRF
jgi:outer membrane immunogenic protein